jgi:hypothetical protein
MDKEMYSIEKNDTWDLVKLPKGKYCNGVKWVYKTKFNKKGEVEKYNVGLVTKGFAQ